MNDPFYDPAFDLSPDPLLDSLVSEDAPSGPQQPRQTPSGKKDGLGIPPEIADLLKARTKPETKALLSGAAFTAALLSSRPPGVRPNTASTVLPVCPLCSSPADAFYDTRYVGALSIAHLCDCGTEQSAQYGQEMRRVWNQRNALPILMTMLPDRLQPARLETLERTEDNFHAVNLAATESSLYFYGNPGTGKSYIAAASGIRDAEQGKTVGYYSAPELVHAVRLSERGEGPDPQAERFQVLLLDDLDKARPTPLGWEYLFRLTEHFYARRKRLIVTSQYKISETARMVAPGGVEQASVAAFASRLGHGERAMIAGHDRRFGAG